MLILNGLRIDTGDAVVAGDPPADVTWRTRRSAALPVEPGAGDPIAIVRSVQTRQGTQIDHVFGHGGRVRCRFRVDPDGSAVQCDAIPTVSARDLFSLFVEPVMRTILFRRGLMSFHAAALARHGRAILIMADKGAGKSTLAWALRIRGWQLLADDLARTDLVDGRWSVFPGHRQTKLTGASARAFGRVAEALPSRFDDPGPEAYAAPFDKRVIDPTDDIADPGTAVPLAAILFLHGRDPAATDVRMERLSPPAAVRLLVEHGTPDPVGENPSVPRGQERMIGQLAMQVKIIRATLPDRFDRLDAAAAAIEREVGG